VTAASSLTFAWPSAGFTVKFAGDVGVVPFGDEESFEHPTTVIIISTVAARDLRFMVFILVGLVDVG
jgi:hypothetical protein